MRGSRPTIVVVVALLIVLIAIAASFIISIPSAVTANTTTILQQHGAAMAGILIPLYSAPDSPIWFEVSKVKSDYKSVPVIAIIDPNNGPGASQNSTYTFGVELLKATGTRVAGYIDTDYGAVPFSNVTRQINEYKDWYSSNNIFLDRMASAPGMESYYSNITKYVDSLGMNLTIGNAGTNVSSSYMGTVDNIVVYEGSGLPSLSYLMGISRNYSGQGISFISYGVPDLNVSYVMDASKYASFMYITNFTAPGQYSNIPPYFTSFAAALASTTSG
ncbi:MAG: hypothetical protein KGH98_02075 [Candidatus Micrarchaeota archaeon]|nr:hypothetical protein [Candidatus Micrarchaeota archaeon]